MSLENKGMETKSGEVIVLKKDGLNGLFRAVVGSRSSEAQVFRRRIIVAMPELDDLQKKIRQKLSRENIPLAEFGLIVALQDDQTKEFASWEEFANYDWKISSTTKTISFRWEFMIEFDRQEATHHTITVRIANYLNPMDFMRMIFERDPRIGNSYDLDPNSPVMCRVDFSDKLLSQEILAIVREWNKSCRSPEAVFRWTKFVDRHDDLIKSTIAKSVPIFSALAFAAVFYAVTSGSKLEAASSSMRGGSTRLDRNEAVVKC